jgi:hypothetical protein
LIRVGPAPISRFVNSMKGGDPVSHRINQVFASATRITVGA